MSASHLTAATRTGANPLVRLDAVGKSYPGVRALESISLDFYEGEIHSIVGENGAGKSTLVRMLAGLEQPDAGTILVDGRPVRLKNPRGFFSPDSSASSAWSVPIPPPPPPIIITDDFICGLGAVSPFKIIDDADALYRLLWNRQRAVCPVLHDLA